uniref:leucine--tRNA ligase n=1 Tax=Oncorhynchus kisutch TaxID=8019 RepID=A0A8C7D494_ONCKI
MAACNVSLCPRDSGLFRLGLGRPRSRADRALMAPLPHLLSPCPRAGARTLFSETGVWDRDYKADTRRRVECWWHPRIMEQWRKDTLEEVSAKPNGLGCHGIPAENAAIERGLDPEEWTKSNIQSMREQLDSLGLCFNWDKEVITCLPDYYRWTQWLNCNLCMCVFQVVVNWDPVDQTVLADEQVDDSGCSWRSGALVEQKLLRQWLIKTTNYAKPLLDALAELPECYGVKAVLANLIGDCTGCYFDFHLMVNGEETGETLAGYTSSPEAVFGAAYLSIVPSHRLLHGTSPVRSALERVLQTGRDCLTEVTAHNLFTGQELPLVISSKQEFEGHLDTVIGTWIHLSTTSNSQTPNSTMAKTKELSKDTRNKILDLHQGIEDETWLGLSRQRYWGTPIPMVHCGSCGPVAAPEEQLPITLPKLLSLTGKGASPLKHTDDWISCTCPRWHSGYINQLKPTCRACLCPHHTHPHQHRISSWGDSSFKKMIVP